HVGSSLTTDGLSRALLLPLRHHLGTDTVIVKASGSNRLNCRGWTGRGRVANRTGGRDSVGQGQNNSTCRHPFYIVGQNYATVLRSPAQKCRNRGASSVSSASETFGVSPIAGQSDGGGQ